MANIMPRIDRHFRSFITVILPVLLLFSTNHAEAVMGNAPWVGTVVNGPKCDGGYIGFGPHDYLQRDHLQSELKIVEDFHFNPDPEDMNQRGSPTTPLDDIHYTLQAWPNHHKALYLAVRYRLHHPGAWTFNPTEMHTRVYRSGFPAECYLQRAINFSPNDPVPFMLYGMLLHKMKLYDNALQQYRSAIRLVPNDIVTLYNMGLTLVEMKNYNEAMQVAEKVYGAGFPLPALKKKLIDAGHWKAEATDTTNEVTTNKPVRPNAVSSEISE